MEHLYVVFKGQASAAREALASGLLRDLFEVCCAVAFSYRNKARVFAAQLTLSLFLLSHNSKSQISLQSLPTYLSNWTHQLQRKTTRLASSVCMPSSLPTLPPGQPSAASFAQVNLLVNCVDIFPSQNELKEKLKEVDAALFRHRAEVRVWLGSRISLVVGRCGVYDTPSPSSSSARFTF